MKRKRTEKLSFGNAMFTNGGYLALAFSIAIAFIMSNALPDAYQWAGGLVFIVLYLSTLLSYREAINKKIADGEFDSEITSKQ